MEQSTDLVSANLAEMSHALSVASPELIEEFLYSLFTASEADEIAKRWALVKEIAGGKPQREIAKALGLSLCKITRGSRELKKEGSSFRRMLALAGFTVPENFGRRIPSAHPHSVRRTGPKLRPAEESRTAVLQA